FERLTVDLVFDRVVANAPLAVLAFLPGIGLAIATLWLRGPGRGVSPATADEYLDAFHTGRRLRMRDLAHRLVAAVATLGTGNAAAFLRRSRRRRGVGRGGRCGRARLRLDVAPGEADRRPRQPGCARRRSRGHHRRAVLDRKGPDRRVARAHARLRRRDVGTG